MKRLAARAICIKEINGTLCLLLMHRIKNNNEYYTFPGGGVEENETVEECVVREVFEEFSINVNIINFFEKYEDEQSIQHFYIVSTEETQIELGGKEKEINSNNNNYSVEWVNINNLSELNLYPKIIYLMVKKYIEKI